jgi:hypothetical protein
MDRIRTKEERKAWDRFAAAVIRGAFSSSSMTPVGEDEREDLAADAAEMADTMLAERRKRDDKEEKVLQECVFSAPQNHPPPNWRKR